MKLTQNVYDNFSKNIEILDFSNHSARQKYYDESNVLFVGKMK